VEDQLARQSFSFPASFKRFPKDCLEKSIVSCFEKQVRCNPNNLAIKYKDVHINYGELNSAANRLVGGYLNLEVPHGPTVILLVEQGITLIASILAALKLGVAYIPLDRRLPIALLKKMIADIQPKAIFSDKRNLDLAQTLAEGSIPVMNTEDVDDSLAADNPGLPVTPEAIAYIFYTSGSTGKPKGVVDIHRNVLHNVMRYTNTLGFSAEDRMSLVQHSSFSGTVSTIFGALLNGASLFPYDLARDGLSSVGDWARREKITIFHSVPSIFRQLTLTDESYPDLRLIRLEGDSTSCKDIEIFQSTFDANCVLVNGLGATECGLVRQFFIDKNTKCSKQIVPVGYALEDVDVRVIDKSGSEVSDEEVGEIVVRSRYLALEYWRNPELTAAKFELEGSGMRLYHTGDLGFMSADGCLRHLGRKDFQTRIRGVSVNMADVEATVLMLRGVEQVLVKPYTDNGGERHLAAYIILHRGSTLTVSDIVEYLEPLVPGYMIPSKYIFVDALPYTLDGKVDRSALAFSTSARPLLSSPYLAPETELESSMVSIWAEVLELELNHVGIVDSFFDLGGDSLRASQAVIRFSERLGIEINIISMFEHRTIRSLIKSLGNDSLRESDRFDHVSKRGAKQRAALARFKRRD
jgi:amino acid adenylation domain-containing protein